MLQRELADRASPSRPPNASKEKADLIHAIYDRITVAGPDIMGVRLTQAAYAHPLALALSEKIETGAPDSVRVHDIGDT